MSPAMNHCIDCGGLIRRPARRCRSCNDQYQRGENNPSWKGGISIDRMHYNRIQRQRFPEKHRARSMVYHALRKGKLVRQACNWPGCQVGPEETEAHHWSYTPGSELDVTFFCRQHHRLADPMCREEYDLIRATPAKRASRKQRGPRAGEARGRVRA